MRTRHPAVVAAVLLAITHAAFGTDAPPGATAARGTVVVTLADGSTVPLRGWSLSYEYGRYRQGQSPLSGTTARKEVMELILGKRTLPVAGLTITLSYDKAAPGSDLVVVKTLQVKGADGKPAEYKVEAPARERLAADLPKGEAVMARTLDLRGETLTGTRRDFCLISHTSVVQCGTTPEDRVVRVEFVKE